VALVRYPGTYNARRGKLEESLSKLFGHQHGIMIVTKFYENVDRAGKNVVLEVSIVFLVSSPRRLRHARTFVNPMCDLTH